MSGADARAAAFARRFAEFWRGADPGAPRRVLAERVRLVAPMTPTTDTLADGKRAFADLFRADPRPDRRGPPLGGDRGRAPDQVHPERHGGGAPISWNAVDRIALGDDGLATERISYFDSLPLILTIARRPRAWPAFLRSRWRRR